MSITVTFNSFEEMVAFAQVLLKGYKTEPVKGMEVVQKAEEPIPSKNETSMNTVPIGIEDEVPFEGGTVMTYTLEEVRAELAKLTRAGKQKEVKELLAYFKAKNLSGVDPKDYAALMKKAGEL